MPYSRPKPHGAGKTLIEILGAALIFCGIFGVICNIPIWLNNRTLNRFANNLHNYPLPPQTNIVGRRATVDLMGNGNHCDFLVEVQLSSSLSFEEITSYYRDVKVPAASRQSEMAGDGLLPVQVVQQNSTTIENSNHFLLRVLDSGYPPGFDIRCH